MGQAARALDSAELLPTADRSRAYTEIGHSLLCAEDPTGAKDAYERALIAAEAIADVFDRARALAAVAGALAQLGEGERDEAVETARKALTAAEAIEDSRSRVRVLADVASALAQLGEGERDEAVETARKALTAAEAFEYFLGDEVSAAVEALVAVVGALGQLGDAAGLERAFTATRMIHDSYRTPALVAVVAARGQLGDAAGLKRTLTAAEAIEDSRSKVRVLADVASALAQLGEGERDEAVETARKALTAAEAIVDASAKAHALVAVAGALAQFGEDERPRAGDGAQGSDGGRGDRGCICEGPRPRRRGRRPGPVRRG